MTEQKSVYQELAETIMVPASKYIPKLFAMLASEDEAKILLALPGTADDLAGQFGMQLPEMEAKLQEFFVKGVVFKSRKPEGVKYRFCREVVQFHDASILWPDATKEFYDTWQRFMEEEWPSYTQLMENFLPRPFSRIIPVEKSISAKSQVLAFESCSDLIDQSARIAVARCPCRITAHKCEAPIRVCLQIGKAANYTIERGTGKEISKEEAKVLLRDCEEAGLIHVTLNKAENMHFICNCCRCCCIAMPVMIKYGRKLVDPSRFLAVVDPDLCENCGTCEERCFFTAITSQESDRGQVTAIDPEKCMGCGICQITCPSGAISLIEVREKEFVPSA
jgi:NAD-dependent dihydropyrimidine dehydrogenase PreA subunit